MPKDPKKTVMMMVRISTVFWIIGLLLILGVFYLEFVGSYSALTDSTSSRTLMTMKLGGIGMILSGIFISLIAIVKVLSMMPVNLSKVMKKKR